LAAPRRPYRRTGRPARSPRRNETLVGILILAAIFGLWFLLGMPQRYDPPVKGNATMRDADTLDIGTQTFRLLGADALEFNQTCIRDGETAPWPCGKQAARALAGHIRGKTVTCIGEAKDRYGRTLATCTIDGADIAAWLVENGWAFDSGRFGLGDYAALEREAANAKRGAWSGRFDKPWEWRPDHPLPQRPPPIP
jgi:endonuclease YncB( thermonuclease family)